jgi:outer membrane immunogenic protein
LQQLSRQFFKVRYFDGNVTKAVLNVLGESGRNMKFLAVAAGLLLVSSISLRAADVENDTIDVSSGRDWSGPYIGAHVGSGEVDVNGSYLGGDVEFGLEPTDPFLGGQAGFNWQIDQIVIGIEADVSLAEWDDEKGPNSQDQFVSADLDWLVTLRARLGWTFEDILLFGTLGGAWANGELTGVEDITAPVLDRSNAHFDDFGLVAGGGIEWAVSDRWSWKLEGLWINFDKNLDITGLTTNSDASDFVEFDDAWLIWTGINLHF